GQRLGCKGARADSLVRDQPAESIRSSTNGSQSPLTMERIATVAGSTSLIDILDRILDKGLVVAGDIRISLANVELLTIRIRLLVCSVDKAEQIGMNWWKNDPNLTVPAREHLPSALPGPAPAQ